MSPLVAALVLGILSHAEVVLGGCRWYNPIWLPSLDSAPLVQISEEKLVTVEWKKDQFEDKFDCADKFEVGVENSAVEGERRLCSVNRASGVETFQCKLDLSSKSHCGQRFGFWVTAVNLNHNRGVERVRSYANSVIDVKCDGESLTKKVKSTSCQAVSPTWQSEPFIQQNKEDQLQIEWDKGQLLNSHCVEQFVLKFWESSSFSPQYTTLKFSLSEGQDKFGGKLEVVGCKSYTYILSALTRGGKARDIQGDFTIPCPGEPFLEPLGEKFVKQVQEVTFGTTSVEESETGNEADFVGSSAIDTNAIDGSNNNDKTSKAMDPPGSVEKSETGKEADLTETPKTNTNIVDGSKTRDEASKAIDLPGSKETSITFAEEASNNIDPEFSNVQRNVEEIQTNLNTHNVKHPQLVALNSTDESLTWQLEGLDPKIRIDKYQVACWDDLNNNVLVDLPCCKVEETPEVEGDSKKTLTVEKLQPNTTYSCQGGMLVQGQWMFSPKALKITQGRSGSERSKIHFGYFLMCFVLTREHSLLG